MAQGEAAIRARIDALRAQGVGVAVVDAVSNDDLLRLGPALKGMPLVTAGSGVAIGLPANFGLAPSPQASALPPATGLQAVVSGSCSLATNRQVAHFIAAGRPAFAVDPLRLAAGDDVAAAALAWAAPLLADGPVLVYSTAEPGAVKSVQGQLGVEEAGAMVERCIADHCARPGRARRAPAHRGRRRNLRRVCAGAGHHADADRPADRPRRAVVSCHDCRRRACTSRLKSGNFGTDDFFTKAFTVLA